MSEETKTAADFDPNQLVHRATIVRILGIADRSFSRLEAEGVMVPTEPGSGRRPSQWALAPTLRAYMQHREVKLTGSLEQPAQQRDRAVAELTQLRIAKERGRLVPLDDVVKEGQAFVVATVAKLRQLAPRMVRAGIVPASEVPRVDELLREALEEISRWQTALDLRKAAADERGQEGQAEPMTTQQEG